VESEKHGVHSLVDNSSNYTNKCKANFSLEASRAPEKITAEKQNTITKKRIEFTRKQSIRHASTDKKKPPNPCRDKRLIFTFVTSI